jgi:hypothetical protein
MSTPDPLDICACGCNREDHPNGGRCIGFEHRPRPCMSFRLAATAEDIAEGFAEWSAMCAEEGK